MSYGRAGHACGQVENAATGKEEVVVAGGWAGGQLVLQSVDIYSVPNDNWRSGTPLPQSIQFANYVSFEDSFLVIGGAGHSLPLGKIYKVIKYL